MPLRPYASADLDAVVDCWFETWYATFAPEQRPQLIEIWRRRFFEDYAKAAEVWIAPDGARVAGFMVLFPRTGWIEQLFVRPEFQNRGIGRSLVELARSRCPLSLKLNTPVDNSRAREFYRKVGFTVQKAGYDSGAQRVVLRYVSKAQ